LTDAQIAYSRWAVHHDGQIVFISNTRGGVGEQECLLWMLQRVGNSAIAAHDAGYRIRPYR
jgi:hypothetical protein